MHPPRWPSARWEVLGVLIPAENRVWPRRFMFKGQSVVISSSATIRSLNNHHCLLHNYEVFQKDLTALCSYKKKKGMKKCRASNYFQQELYRPRNHNRKAFGYICKIILKYYGKDTEKRKSMRLLECKHFIHLQNM